MLGRRCLSAKTGRCSEQTCNPHTNHRVDMNPGWEYKLWDRADAEALLKKYPQYQDTYRILPKDVERGDFLRYAGDVGVNSHMRACERRSGFRVCHICRVRPGPLVGGVVRDLGYRHDNLSIGHQTHLPGC